MTDSLKRIKILSGNELKLAALIAMTIDHIGMILFPDTTWLRVIGRIAMPIFAFMIAEGCYYTRSRLKHFLTIFGVGVLCQVVRLLFVGDYYQSILITFSMSTGIIYLLQESAKAIENSGEMGMGRVFLFSGLLVLAVAAAAFICSGAGPLSSLENFNIDYGLTGVLMPVVIYLPILASREKDARCLNMQILVAAVWIIPLSLAHSSIQWWSMLSVIFLLMYNGKRGKYSLKYLFYAYFPAHLGILYLLEYLIR